MLSCAYLGQNQEDEHEGGDAVERRHGVESAFAGILRVDDELVREVERYHAYQSRQQRRDEPREQDAPETRRDVPVDALGAHGRDGHAGDASHDRMRG
eukprot:scaffold8536_cov248-Pinguiococcus_pyrenoidosus.AAC.7